MFLYVLRGDTCKAVQNGNMAMQYAIIWVGVGLTPGPAAVDFISSHQY